MRLCIFDTETTSIDDDAKVVEIGAVWFTLEGGEVHFEDALSTLVHPGVPIPPTASAIHHITDDMVAGAPAYEYALADFPVCDVYVAHNAEFDKRLLPEYTGDWICTMKVAYDEWADAPSYGNQALSYWLKAPRPPEGSGHAHRALYDCYTTFEIFKALYDLGWTVEQMVNTSNRPRLLREIPFGKHKGEKWSAAPRSYIDWMKKQNDWDADISYTLKELFG